MGFHAEGYDSTLLTDIYTRLGELSVTRGYSIAVIGSASAEVTLNNSNEETGWLDVSLLDPNTMSLLIDASTDTGTITVDIAFAEDSAGITATGYVATSAGITTTTILKVADFTNWPGYAHFIKIKVTETATADFIFKSVLMGREI